MRGGFGCSQWLWAVLFFIVVEGVRADEGQLRQALDQLSGTYAAAEIRLRDQEVALRTLTASLAIARTESELFQRLWTEAQVRAGVLGANLLDSDVAATQAQLIEVLRQLYRADAERQQVTEMLKQVVTAVESQKNVAAEVGVAKQWLAAKPVQAERTVDRSSLTRARVLEVNPKLQLVVLDIGAGQGVRIGMPLIILRGDRVVAELRVVEVRSKISGALIEKVENNVKLQAGDTAQVTKG